MVIVQPASDVAHPPGVQGNPGRLAVCRLAGAIQHRYGRRVQFPPLIIDGLCSLT